MIAVMKIESHLNKQPVFIIITMLLGIVTGLSLVIAAASGAKWLAAMMLGMMAFFSLCLVTRSFRIMFLCGAVFALPIRLDFQLLLRQTPFSQIKGISVSLFDLIFLLLLLFWLIQLMKKKQHLKLFPSISIPAIIYILIAGISIIQSENMTLSFFYLISIMKSYVVFLFFANNIETKDDIFWIIMALTFAILFQSLIGFLQHVTGGTLGIEILGESERAFGMARAGQQILSRVGGTLGSANNLAMYLNFYIPILFSFLFVVNEATRIKIFVGIVILCGVLAEILTLSRGAWVGLACAMIICFYGIYKDRFKSRIKSYILTLIVISFVSISILSLFSSVRSRLFEGDYGSAYSRIPMSKVALEIILNNKLKGVGLNNYTTVMNRYDLTIENISYKFPYAVHNAFLLIAAESGIPALIIVLFIMFTVSKKALLFFKGKDRYLSYIGIGSYCGFLTWCIHSLFRLEHFGLNILLWFSFALIISLNRLLLSENNSASK
jgi:hypothetical protein